MPRPRTTLRTVPHALALALLCLAGVLTFAARGARSAETHNFRVVSLATKDIVVDPSTRTVYASLPSTAGAAGNSIMPLDPYTGAAGAAVFVGSEPGDLAISDDGRVIYAALDGARAVRRFDVATQTAGLQFSLGPDSFGAAYAPRQLRVAPGAPDTVAVQTGGSQFDSKLLVFDAGVRRGAPLPSAADYIEFSATASRLYLCSTAGGVMGGYLGFQKVNLTAAGLANEGDGVYSSRRPGELRHAGGRVYDGNGTVYDAETGAVLGTFPVPYFISPPSVVPDPAAGRVYFVSSDAPNAFGNTAVTLRAFDINTFQEVGSTPVTGASGQPAALARWGTDGLVFRTQTQVVIVRTTLVGPAGSDPTPTPTPTPAPTPTPSPTPTQFADVVRRVDLPANDLVVEPKTQTIYASVPSRAGAGGNSITPLNPFTAAVGAPVFVGSEPGQLAISDEGSFIYVALAGAAAVRRFDVATQTAGPQFPVDDADPQGPNYVRDMAVMPGSPHTLAVSKRVSGYYSPDYRGVAVYDDGVPRPVKVGGYPGTYGIEFSDSPALIYASGDTGLQRLAVDASGVARGAVTTPGPGSFKFAGGRIYTDTGQVIDPASGAVVGTYADPGRTYSTRVLPDPALKRTYFISDNGYLDASPLARATINVYDQQTFLKLGSVEVAGIRGEVGSLVRWGDHGLAFATAGGQIFLVETALVPSPAPAPTPAPPPTPAPTPTPVPTPAAGELRELAVPAKDIALDPATQLIYASAQAEVKGHYNSITPIEPASGAVGTPVDMETSGRMAVSDDGRHIYVAADGQDAGRIRRFDVTTLTPGAFFNVNQTPGSTAKYSVQDMSVMPGRPEVLAVARGSLTSGGMAGAGVAVYEGGVQRPAVAAGGTAVEFSNSPEVLYSYHGLESDLGFRKMVVGPCGIATARVSNLVTNGDIRYDNGRVYSTGGAIDPETGSKLGAFTPTSGGSSDSFNTAFTTDTRARRMYAVGGAANGQGAPGVLRAYDTETFLPAGELRLPGVKGRPTRLLRWGARGLAFVTREDVSYENVVYRLYLLENDLVAAPSGSFVPAPPPPTPTLSVRGQVTYFGGLPDVTLGVTGTHTTSAVTDGAGNYTLEGIPHCADITVTPSKENYTFTPPSVRLTDPGGVYRLNFTATPKRVYFPNSLRSLSESGHVLQVLVRRDGDLSRPATVEYETADGTASARSDYTAAFGTLRFEPNESQKTLDLLVTNDALVEGLETFTLKLKDPAGAMLMAPPFDALTVRINDDDAAAPASNPLRGAEYYVRQHYADFLNREPDPVGLAFWSGQIAACDAQPDAGARATCLEDRRVEISQAFFLSIEFQATGYLVHRLYTASFPAGPARPGGLPRLAEFLRDTQEIGRGVVVGRAGWPEQLESNKRAFALAWVQRPEFAALYPAGMSAGAYVDALFANAGVQPSAAGREAAVAAYGAGDAEGRAAALRGVADSREVYNRQYNSAFVLMQYFGYMRRNPNDAPDSDLSGYGFWLSKLDEFSLPGEDVRDEQTAVRRVRRAEMVRAFLVSAEYQQRFGPTDFDLRQ